MLTVGIAIMVTSVVAGLGALTFLALKSSPARAAGRRVGATLAVSNQQPGAPYHPAQQDVGYYRGEQNAPPYTAEAEPPPLVLTLAAGSAAGLLLGLLLVMIGSML